jgi:hypothetical protein
MTFFFALVRFVIIDAAEKHKSKIAALAHYAKADRKVTKAQSRLALHRKFGGGVIA